jgi:hypothetical protein
MRLVKAKGSRMPKNRYCEMCDKFFPMIRTIWCPLCGDQTRRAEYEPGLDVVCRHGVAMDVHCCNCHSGFLFDSNACTCLSVSVKD